MFSRELVAREGLKGIKAGVKAGLKSALSPKSLSKYSEIQSVAQLANTMGNISGTIEENLKAARERSGSQTPFLNAIGDVLTPSSPSSPRSFRPQPPLAIRAPMASPYMYAKFPKSPINYQSTPYTPVSNKTNAIPQLQGGKLRRRRTHKRRRNLKNKRLTVVHSKTHKH